MSINRISLFVKKVFFEFTNASIPYCVLRFSEDGWMRGGDVDILLASERVKQAVSILTSIAQNESAVVIFNNKSGCHHHVIISFPDVSILQTQSLIIDFQSAILEAGCVYLEAQKVLACVDTRSELPRPAPSMEATILLIHSVVGKQYFKSRYWSFIQNVYKDYPGQFLSALALVCHLGNAKVLCQLISNNNPEGVLTFHNKFLSSEKNKKLDVFTVTLWTFFTRVSRRIQWFINPPGKFIDLEGSDNERNSIVGKQLMNALEGAPYKSIYLTFSNCNNILKINKKSYNRDYLSNFCSSIRSTGFVIPQVLKAMWIYLRIIRPLLARNCVVFTDGYLLGMRSLSLNHAKHFYWGRVYKLIPTPDFIFYLQKIKGKAKKYQISKLTETTENKGQFPYYMQNYSRFLVSLSADTVDDKLILNILRIIFQ